MLFDTKIALVIRDDLATWQKMNVAAFLASGIAASHPESIGEPLAVVRRIQRVREHSPGNHRRT